MADFERAFEDLLYRRRPAWHVVGGDRDRLIGACIDWLTPERVRSFDTSTPADRATWILDRLLPLREIDIFRRLNGYERWLYTLYPLFRRAPEEMASVTPERFRNGECLAADAAWVETRGSDDELFGWHAECLRRGWPNAEVHSNTLAVVEYCRRSPDAGRIVAYLDEAPPHEIPVLLHCLARLVAPSLPRTETPEPALCARLAEAGLEALAEAFAAAIARQPDWPQLPGGIRLEATRVGPPPPGREISRLERRLAAALWTEQQGAEDADRLVREAPLNAPRRLASIVPGDRADVWDRVLANCPHELGFMHAFSRWCTPPHRDRLRRHFRHDDAAWASCAFRAYLSLATPDEVAALAKERGRTDWQREDLDRWMHAPPELRPPLPRVSGPFEIVFDLRECDPFDYRGP